MMYDLFRLIRPAIRFTRMVPGIGNKTPAPTIRLDGYRIVSALDEMGPGGLVVAHSCGRTRPQLSSRH